MVDRIGSVSGAAWVCAAVAGALALGGCASSGSAGSASLASLSAPVAGVQAGTGAPVEPPAPAPVVYGSFLGGAAGNRLPEADRAVALAAENGALSSGERRTWKGARGVYGFVEPGAAAAAAGAASECRSFSSTIYFAGRPQTGRGTGCRDADGTWHVTS